jgi:hypothetical protein
MIEKSSEARKLEYIPSVYQRRGPEWALASRKGATYIVQSDSLSANMSRKNGRMSTDCVVCPLRLWHSNCINVPGWSVFQYPSNTAGRSSA